MRIVDTFDEESFDVATVFEDEDIEDEDLLDNDELKAWEVGFAKGDRHAYL